MESKKTSRHFISKTPDTSTEDKKAKKMKRSSLEGPVDLVATDGEKTTTKKKTRSFLSRRFRRAKSVAAADEEEAAVMTGSVSAATSEGLETSSDEIEARADAVEKRIPYEEWFDYITGMSEVEFRKQVKSGAILDKIEVVPADRKDVPPKSHSVKINGHDAGTLFVCSISELHDLAVKNKGSKDVSPILYFDTQNGFGGRNNVDIAMLQAEHKNKGATFQVASNFNGIEAVEDRSTPDENWFVTNYICDQTQGPAASISAGPAAIARVFTPFYTEKTSKKPDKWRQTKKDQIELLKDLGDYFAVRNGYVVNTKKQLPLPSDPTELRALEDKVKVCVHVDVEVPFRRSDYSDMAAVLARPNTINQVFCAAMNLSQGSTGYANSVLKDSDEKARFLLRAAYRGTFLAALNRGSRKLFLTLIGGGAFGNNKGDILRTIVDVHEEIALDKGINGSLEEVHVTLFTNPSCLSMVLAEVKERKIPFRYVVYGDSKIVADRYPAKQKRVTLIKNDD